MKINHTPERKKPGGSEGTCHQELQKRTKEEHKQHTVCLIEREKGSNQEKKLVVSMWISW